MKYLTTIYSDSQIGNRNKDSKLNSSTRPKNKNFITKTRTKRKYLKQKKNYKLQLKSNALILRTRRFGLPIKASVSKEKVKE